MPEINPNEVYTTKETEKLLKTSNSTMKRLLKKGIIKANKVGGRYKILGSEILRLVSPTAQTKVIQLYHNLKDKTKKAIEKW
jgi:excisionase family DNA binding protein